jgi:hypothetical protein
VGIPSPPAARQASRPLPEKLDHHNQVWRQRQYQSWSRYGAKVLLDPENRVGTSCAVIRSSVIGTGKRPSASIKYEHLRLLPDTERRAVMTRFYVLRYQRMPAVESLRPKPFQSFVPAERLGLPTLSFFGSCPGSGVTLLGMRFRWVFISTTGPYDRDSTHQVGTPRYSYLFFSPGGDTNSHFQDLSQPEIACPRTDGTGPHLKFFNPPRCTTIWRPR